MYLSPRRVNDTLIALCQDLRYAARSLRKSPGLVTAAVFALALGIGANTALFSVINAVLLQPLPYRQAERLMVVSEKRQKEGTILNGVAPADYFDWRAQNRVFSSLTAHDLRPFALTGGGEPERVIGVLATADMLDTYGVQPVLGRGFQPGDDEQDRHVALLSHGAWQRRFGGDPRALDTPVSLDGQAYTIIGILPASFRNFFGQDPDVYLPFAMSPQRRQNRGMHELLVIGRLRDGVSQAQAQAEMDVISRQLEAKYPLENTGHSANVVTLQSQITGHVRNALLLLSGAVAFVLLIACANVANLLLVRAIARQREIAIRQALGASPGRIICLLLAESLLLSVLGGALGVFLAEGGLAALQAFLPRDLGGMLIPGIDRIRLDGRVRLFTLGVSALTGLVFGLAPALELLRSDVQSGIKASGRALSSGVPQRRLRGVLVVTEMALACVLLIGAMLLTSSLLRVLQVNPGFHATQRLSIQVDLPASRYPKPAQQIAFYQLLLDRVSTVPAVASAAITSYVPGDMFGSRSGLRMEGRPQPRTIEDWPKAHFRVVSDGFLAMMGVPVLRGRAFSAQDRADSAPVVLISQTTARRYWGAEEPVGQRVAIGTQAEWRTIVGVVGDLRHQGLDKDFAPEIYIPLPQFPFRLSAMALVIHSSAPEGLVSAVRHEVTSLDRALPLGRVSTIQQLLDKNTAPYRFQAQLLGLLSGVALVLALGGLYSVMAFLVAQRRHEFGIRVALGAQPAAVCRMVVRQGAVLASWGVLIGTGASLLVTRLLSGYLYGVTRADPLIYGLVGVTLFVSALAASYLPARRASQADPLAALRCE